MRHNQRPSRGGITLVEVLVSIFVLGLGLLGVLSLFTAGRDLETRAVRKSNAIAYADTIELRVVDQWSRVSNWRWTNTGGSDPDDWFPLNPPATNSQVQFPVVVDPYALNADTDVVQIQDVSWNWSRFVEAPPNGDGAIPFRRTSVFGIVPPPVTAILASLADPDAVEFRLDQQNQSAPPANAFEFGRRVRGTEFTPALFIAQHPAGSSTANAFVSVGVPVIRWLLIFRNLPVNSLDESDSAAPPWPTGFLRFQTDEAQGEMVTISVSEPLLRKDDGSLRRSLKPGQWILITHNPSSVVAPDKAWMVHWARIVSSSEDAPYDGRRPWLLTIDPPLPGAFDRPPENGVHLAYTFESLVHVKRVDLTAHLLD